MRLASGSRTGALRPRTFSENRSSNALTNANTLKFKLRSGCTACRMSLHASCHVRHGKPSHAPDMEEMRTLGIRNSRVQRQKRAHHQRAFASTSATSTSDQYPLAFASTSATSLPTSILSPSTPPSPRPPQSPPSPPRLHPPSPPQGVAQLPCAFESKCLRNTFVWAICENSLRYIFACVRNTLN